MGQKIIVANLKMQQDLTDVTKYLKVINKEKLNKNIVICPSSIYLPYFLKQSYSVGLQNVFFRSKGAYTGEISPLQAKSIGISYVIVGHSERRTYFDESDIDINNKIIESLKHDLKIILCIGETLEERNLLKTDKVLRRQLLVGLKNIEDFKNIYIAYEPVWAIGTNIVPSNKEIENTVNFIKETADKLYDVHDITVLYGGSVNEENIKTLESIKNINGYLIGGASLDTKKLLKIIKTVD